MDPTQKKFIETMLARAANNDKTKAQPKNDVDITEVENLTKSIQRRIQRGE